MSRERENSPLAIDSIARARVPGSALGGVSGDVGVVIWSVWVLGEGAGVVILQNRAEQGFRERPLDEKTRRRPESVVAATFERLGKQFEGGGFTAAFAQLFAGVNIERPFSETLLRSILENDDTGAFAKDPDGPNDYTYIPGTPA